VFVSREDFEQAIASGLFLEWAEFNGNLYGTPKPEAQKGDVVLEIDSQGVRSIKALDPAAFVIVLAPPSLDDLAKRMRDRGDAEAHVKQRIELARGELADLKKYANLWLVNDDLEATIDSVVQGVTLELGA
jgi:guanylate kinase